MSYESTTNTNENGVLQKRYLKGNKVSIFSFSANGREWRFGCPYVKGRIGTDIMEGRKEKGIVR